VPVADIRSYLKFKGVDCKGKKAELIDRVEKRLKVDEEEIQTEDKMVAED